MKSQINKKSNPVVRPSRNDIFYLILPTLLWVATTCARPQVIRTNCISSPQSCTKESVLAIDQLSLGMEDWKADENSYFTQNFSGVLAFAIPTAWNAGLVLARQLTPMTALMAWGLDLVIISETIAWNGFFTESSHLISQRPRPFVYSNPPVRGTDPAHYTSFYSGHTSFTAAATAAIFLFFLRRKAPLPMLILSAIAFEALVISTAYFRILAGRHFLTDTVCGAIAGSLIAWWVYRRRTRPKVSGPKLA